MIDRRRLLRGIGAATAAAGLAPVTLRSARTADAAPARSGQVREPIYNHYVSGEYSDAGPALGRLGNNLCVAWTGRGNQYLNIMPAVDLHDGRVGFDSTRKLTLDHQGLGGPALVEQNPSANEVLMAWAINPGPNGALPSLIGQGFDQSLATTMEVASWDWSETSPALSRWAGEVNIAWTGSGNGFLNVTPLVFADGGWWFSSDRRFTSTETTPFEPSLAHGWWPNETMYIAWTGHDNALSTMHAVHSSPFDPPPYRTVFDSSTKRTFSGEFSDAGPAIEALGQGLYLCYRGSGNENINVLHVSPTDGAIVGKDTSGHRTRFRPAMVAFPDRLFVAWTGTDGALNLGQVTPYLPIGT